jgi:hypothetical protein
MAGSVAPIAAVAGKRKRKVAVKATLHCQSGAGCSPMTACAQASNGDAADRITSPHAAITPSHAAYQRVGRTLRSMRSPNASAPTAMPPKNAATPARTAAASWPSQSALCCVHTTW